MAMHVVSGLATGLVALTLLIAPAAHALQPATGKVILTLTGKVGDANKAKSAEFDLAMLEKLPQRSFTTMTPWDKKPIKFNAPPTPCDRRGGQ